MEFKEYAKAIDITRMYKDKIIYPTLGLCGESGEVADKIKKVMRDDDGIYSQEIRENILKELGDVLWYINALALDLDSSLEEVARLNIDKLLSRLSRGKLTGSGDNR